MSAGLARAWGGLLLRPGGRGGALRRADGAWLRPGPGGALRRPKVDLAAIKALREATGAPIKDVKAALDAAGGDAEQAHAELRQRGLAAAQKKQGRAATEGLVGLAVGGPGEAVLVEVNSETDFAARNEKVQALVRALCQTALAGPTAGPIPAEALGGWACGGQTADGAVAEAAAAIRENIRLRRAVKARTAAGVVASYVHGALAPGLGRIGTLVTIETDAGPGPKKTAVEELGAKLAMHCAALRPQFLSKETVPEEVIQSETRLLTAQAEESGKPANVVEKMVQGRLNKWFGETCFLHQPFVLDDSVSVEKAIERAAREQGVAMAVTAFARFEVGEGLEKEAADFAEEVESVASKAAGGA